MIVISEWTILIYFFDLFLCLNNKNYIFMNLKIEDSTSE